MSLDPSPENRSGQSQEQGPANAPAHATQSAQQSAYPAPYSPYAAPQPNTLGYSSQQPAFDLLTRMLRAAVMLYITGAFIAISSISCIGMALLGPFQGIFSQMAMDPALSEIATPNFLRGIVGALGSAGALAGIIFIMLGVYVRRGSRAAAIAAAALSGLVLLLSGCISLSNLLQSGRVQGMGEPVAAMCMFLAPMAIMVWQLIWCIQSAGAAGAYRAMQTQMQMQYWQYTQMQQQYAQQASEFRAYNSEGPGKLGGGV